MKNTCSEKKGCKCKQVSSLRYSEAKAMVRRLGITSQQAYTSAFLKGRLPVTMPRLPSLAYPKYWKGWTSFVGSKSTASTETSVAK